jgi:hypothetical protein
MRRSAIEEVVFRRMSFQHHFFYHDILSFIHTDIHYPIFSYPSLTVYKFLFIF